jgi:carboxymethylenebutenolidase
MGRNIRLKASDGFEFGAYRADPAGIPRGRVVVIMEIFGVNSHIRSVCDRLAEAGYVALAPQMFDRLEPDFECGYSDAEIANARAFIPRFDWAKAMLDTEAAIDALKREGAVAVMGFCLGGSVSWLAATEVRGLAGAICFYGGQIIQHIDKTPHCPVQMHFGAQDSHIPLSDVEKIKQKQPQAEIYVYQHAGHGFHCDERGSYDQPSSRIAWERTLGFLSRGFDTTAEEMDEPLQPAQAARIGKQSAAGRSTGGSKPKRGRAKSRPSPAKKSKKKSKAKSKKKTVKKTAKKAAKKAKQKSVKKSKKKAAKKKSKKRR